MIAEMFRLGIRHNFTTSSILTISPVDIALAAMKRPLDDSDTTSPIRTAKRHCAHAIGYLYNSISAAATLLRPVGGFTLVSPSPQPTFTPVASPSYHQKEDLQSSINQIIFDHPTEKVEEKLGENTPLNNSLKAPIIFDPPTDKVEEKLDENTSVNNTLKAPITFEPPTEKVEEKLDENIPLNNALKPPVIFEPPTEKVDQIVDENSPVNSTYNSPFKLLKLPPLPDLNEVFGQRADEPDEWVGREITISPLSTKPKLPPLPDLNEVFGQRADEPDEWVGRAALNSPSYTIPELPPLPDLNEVFGQRADELDEWIERDSEHTIADIPPTGYTYEPSGLEYQPTAYDYKSEDYKYKANGFYHYQPTDCEQQPTGCEYEPMGYENCIYWDAYYPPLYTPRPEAFEPGRLPAIKEEGEWEALDNDLQDESDSGDSTDVPYSEESSDLDVDGEYLPLPDITTLNIGQNRSRVSSAEIPAISDERLAVSEDVTAQRETRARAARTKALRTPFSPLSPEWEKKINEALKMGANGYTAETLRRVFPRGYGREDAWLDDEAINGYLRLVCKAGNDNGNVKGGSTPLFHAFSSFFFETYSNGGYPKVQRWFKRAKLEGQDLLKANMVFFPICKGQNHWVLMVVYPKRKEIAYYDSLGGGAGLLATHMEDILQLHLGLSFRRNQWAVEMRAECPQQTNSDDCGVYTATVAKMLTLGLDLEFTAADIRVQRKIMVAELMNGAFVN
ncbi:MAG: hypothetical protein Q9227_005275 [Pyrenula ochraceoflavens]